MRRIQLTSQNGGANAKGLSRNNRSTLLTVCSNIPIVRIAKCNSPEPQKGYPLNNGLFIQHKV